MLQACLNGGLSKSEVASVPVTPAELATDAKAVKRAGAEQLHIHPRSESGPESLRPLDVAQSLRAVRAAVPGMPVGVGTGAWIEPSPAARLDFMRQWEELPDYASVNLNEDDAFENMEVLLSKGVGIEAGIWTARDAERFVGSPFPKRCLRVLLEMITDEPAEAEREYRSALAVLTAAGVDLPILLHGQGKSVWPMVRLAKAQGHDTRVGFEDGVDLPDGHPAESNEQLVRAAAGMMAER